MGFEHILVERSGDFATITMNRPQRRNALSLDHMRELIRAFSEAGDSNALGIVLAGNGPVFCAGHDFADVAEADLSAVRALLVTCTELMTLMQQVPQPVVARVHSLATAAGCQLVASADLAVASEEAGFAAPGGKGGWFCHTPMVAIARNVGRKRAAELALSGDVIDAQTALDWGLVNKVVPAAQLDSAVQDMLERVTRGSAESKGIGKQALYAQIDLDQPKAYAYAIEVMAATSQLPDAREGMHAFLEKRKPQWRPSEPRRTMRALRPAARRVGHGACPDGRRRGPGPRERPGDERRHRRGADRPCRWPGRPLRRAAGRRPVQHRQDHRPAGRRARVPWPPVGGPVRPAAADSLGTDGVTLAVPEPARLPTTLALVDVDAAGLPRYRFYLDATSAPALDYPALARALPAGVTALHAGSLALAAEPIATSIDRLIAADLPPGTLLMIDPNCRPRRSPTGTAYLARLSRILRRADVVKVSVEDLDYLAPAPRPRTRPPRLLGQGPALVLLTDGPHPARAFLRGRGGQRRGAAGAGGGHRRRRDAFGGAFLAWWSASWADPVRPLRRPAPVRGALQAAAEVAALTCTRVGAEPPWLAEVRDRPGCDGPTVRRYP